MVGLTSNLLTYFRLFLKNDCKDQPQNWHKCSLCGPDQALLLIKICNMTALVSHLLTHFQLLLMYGCRDLLQT